MEIVEKIESIIFDIVGLLIPGLVCIFSLGVTLYLSVPMKDLIEFVSHFAELSSQYVDQKNLYKALLIKEWIWFYILLLLITSYLLGHVIKVFSKHFYTLGQPTLENGYKAILVFAHRSFNAIGKWEEWKGRNARHKHEIMDEISKTRVEVKVRLKKEADQNKAKAKDGQTQNESLQEITSSIKEIAATSKNGEKSPQIVLSAKVYLTGIIIGVLDTLFEFFDALFTFSAGSNKDRKMTDNIKGILTTRLADGFNTSDSYILYKLKTTILDSDQIPNLVNTFLAKYNFSRSLSLLFFINLVIVLVLYYKGTGTPFLQNYFWMIFPFWFIGWFTFHDKYKRYYFLCSVEVDTSVFYSHMKTKDQGSEAT